MNTFVQCLHVSVNFRSVVPLRHVTGVLYLVAIARDCLLGLALITYEYINLRPIHLFVTRLARRHHIESLRNLACSTLSIMPAFFTCFPGSLLLQSWSQSTRSCAIFRLSANYTNHSARAPRADLIFHWYGRTLRRQNVLNSIREVGCRYEKGVERRRTWYLASSVGCGR